MQARVALQKGRENGGRARSGARMLAAFLLLVPFSQAQSGPRDEAAWHFVSDGPLVGWEDGFPVGNGRLGAQSWGTGPKLYLTLDRGDVWDLRYQENHSEHFNYRRLRELVRTGRADLIQQEMPADVSPTADSTPVKLPIGRLAIALPQGTTVQHVDLDMKQAEVCWSLSVNGKPAEFRVFAPMSQEVIAAELRGIENWEPETNFIPLTETDTELIEKLGYEKAIPGENKEYSWSMQRIPQSGNLAVVWHTSRMHGRWTLLLTITNQHDSDILSSGTHTLESARHSGVDGLSAEHRAWWRERWSRSAVHLPEQNMERLWVNGIYKLASSSWKGAPTNLQGLWPPDGWRPPWRGDYHCNLNVQESYWPAYSSNQLDLAEPLNRWLTEKIAPQAETLTKRFFSVDGIWVSTAYDIEGRLEGGHGNWMTVQYWLGGGGWLAQHLWSYYRYSLDEDFLRREAYPFMKKALNFYENILEKGEDGRLHLPLSTSPEYFGNDLKAWTKDPTGDLSVICNLARYCISAAEVLKTDSREQERWRALLAELVPYSTSSRSGLEIQPGVEYDHSHRHPMHLFPIFPGEDLIRDGAQADRDLIERSLHSWIAAGMGTWTGHSYTNGAPIAARLGRGNHALNLLHIYADAFTLPNGFHTNRDYKQLGFDPYTGVIYTVEAECAFTAAINEMLLQSWEGKLRIFPAVPDAWQNVSFENLRAQGALLVSAERRAGRITRASIVAEKGGDVHLVWPPGPVSQDHPAEVRTLHLRPGQRVDLDLRWVQ